MKYLCLICAEFMMEHMTPADAEKHYREYDEFTREMKAGGHFVSANRLTPPDTATTIRVRNGKISMTDGPFAESKEQLGGYFVLEAADHNEAIRLAARIPAAQFGCVEIRPIADDPQTRALGFDSLDSRPVPVTP